MPNQRRLGLQRRTWHLEVTRKPTSLLDRYQSPDSLHLHPQALQLAQSIEIWFGTLRRKLTRYASFDSLENLQEQILRFIDYYNRTMAKPYRWTYTGRLLCE
jgi:hypothetical protein